MDRSEAFPTVIVRRAHPDQADVWCSSDPERLDRALIHAFLHDESYWAPGIPRALVDRALDHSLPFGLYRGDTQVGFARMVTDYATFGYLSDVFVVEAERGQGLARWLVAEVLDHPDLQVVRRITLATADAQPLYASLGFTPGRPGFDMERRRPADELYAAFTSGTVSGP